MMLHSDLQTSQLSRAGPLHLAMCPNTSEVKELQVVVLKAAIVEESEMNKESEMKAEESEAADTKVSKENAALVTAMESILIDRPMVNQHEPQKADSKGQGHKGCWISTGGPKFGSRTNRMLRKSIQLRNLCDYIEETFDGKIVDTFMSYFNKTGPSAEDWANELDGSFGPAAPTFDSS